ncbi:WecB/TagA/CpsF family glycosyltransferase [Peribacillus glennii]|uniref:N-acetylglucosaminyldiphosphoundecaprenol N-acetyl-beta-D-mannosaminyltransferase n=1 Tax=Peribacillus glennii TaxID=2303991 RepID=A0A372LDE6_9BACI|nr:WecB/TagA/CpsF family glycosyltransferase [Peribacillus glennii]RFU63961.1 glycosyltransferase [Peribacillus glennii]
MKIDKIDIMGIPFANVTRKALVEEIMRERLQDGKKTYIVTANPEIVEHASKDTDYRNIICSSDFVIPDGIGVIYASKVLNTPLEERIAGFDLMTELLGMANAKRYKVFLLGAEESVVQLAAENVEKQYKHIDLAGYHHGFIDIEDEALPKQISKFKPDIVFIALGFPKQDQWINKHLHLFDKGIFMGVGGSFDVLAGKVNRAPAVWQKANLEWLYRLIQEPRRWRRMSALPLFMLKVMKKRVTGK